MTSSTIGQRQKDALTTLDFNTSCWWFIEPSHTDADVHAAHSFYVEEMWLPVIGPTCTVILRHLSLVIEAHGSSCLSLEELAHSIGLGNGHGRSSAFARSVARLVGFELADVLGPTRLTVKTTVPWLTPSQIARLHPSLQSRHDHYVKTHPVPYPY
jgi:hypothetical protein